MTIATPSSGQTVCTTFTAAGATDVGNVSGELVKGTTRILGTTSMSGAIWAVQFTNVPEDTYTLEVSDAESTDTVTGVVVSAAAC